MGLDVYLKHSKDLSKALENESNATLKTNELWEKEVVDHDAIKKIYAEFDCDEYGSSNDIETIDIKSKTDPEHMFTIGYFRSSYNGGGINSVLSRAGCSDLYDIFGPIDRDEYYVKPNWLESLSRVDDAIKQYAEFLTSDMSKYDAIHISRFSDNGVKNPQDALALLKNELSRNASFNSYSNRDGDWFLDGITVVGIVPCTGFGGGVYVLTKDSNEPSDTKSDFYLTALKIVKETIEYVLAQPDPENYALAWSA